MARTFPIGLVLLLIVSLGSSFWVAMEAATRNTFDLQRALAELTVEAVVGEVESSLDAAQDQVTFVGELIASGEVDPFDTDRLVDIMGGALAAAPQVSGIAFVRSDYEAVRVGRDEDELVAYRDNWSDRSEIRGAFENVAALNDPSWREVTWVEDFGASHIVVAQPVVRDGAPIGLMFSIVSVRQLSALMREFDQASGINSFVLRGRTEVLAHPTLAEGFSGLSELKPLPLINDVGDDVLASIWNNVVDEMPYLLDESTVEGHVVSGDDDDYIYFYEEIRHVGVTPWIVGVAFRSSDISLTFNRLIWAGVLGLAILIFALVIALLFVRATVRPLGRLAQASEEVSGLAFEGLKPLPGSTFRELDIAAKTFNSMVTGLRWFGTYVPRSLVLRLMRSGGSSVRSEERQVTVLFTDIVGFTQLGAALGPAQLADLLNAHFTSLAEAIEREEGTVDKYIGDSIMAFWGAPLDQPDHAARSCRAALEIAKRVRAENARRGARGERPIKLRIGIHSGPAVVGNIGAPSRVNYTLIGDTVNTAQRLEALGKDVAPDEDVVVLIGVDTKAAIGPEFAYEQVGGFVLRGRDDQSEVYRLLIPEDSDLEPTTRDDAARSADSTGKGPT